MSEKRRRLKLGSRIIIVAVIVLTVCLGVCLSFPGPLINWFIMPRVSEALARSFSQYSIEFGEIRCSVWKNEIGLDSVAVYKADGSLFGKIGEFSVCGFDWRHLIVGKRLESQDFKKATFDAQDLRMNLDDDHYEYLIERVHISAVDSEAAITSFKVHPTCDVEPFFAAGKYRRPRITVSIPGIQVKGLAIVELLQGKGCLASSVVFESPLIDVLINKDKPCAIDSDGPNMPNQVLASIKKRFEIDSLILSNGRIKYGERFGVGETPGIITFDSLEAVVTGITNQSKRGRPLEVRAQGTFMGAGLMTLQMTIPMGTPELSFFYSGSLSKMELSPLNHFLEPAEHIRIKGGEIKRLSYEIRVDSGHAIGSVRAEYSGLSFALLNKKTGSQKGILNSISSFLANTFKVRGTNKPDKSGRIKLGRIDYTKQQSEFFLQFAWFALRSGLGDVAGF
ncbi:MAG: hypothetical protein WAU88_10370 [Candidatus Zixiibacteriota bacterium]